MAWSRDGLWSFPTGEIWVKHFDLELTRGTPATKKRIETRLIVRNATGAYGVSYRWNDAGSEATLVPDGGADYPVNVTVNGSPYTQQWHIPSRSEFLLSNSGIGRRAGFRDWISRNIWRGIFGNLHNRRQCGSAFRSRGSRSCRACARHCIGIGRARGRFAGIP